jgi:signal transduction histidine kinase
MAADVRVRAHLALLAIVILVPVVALSAAGLHILLRAERASAHANVRETARAVALAVDRELAAAEAALRVLATSRYLAEGDLRGFYGQATIARTSDNAWIVLFDRDAQQVVNTRFPLGSRLARRNLPEIVTQVMQSQRFTVSDIYQGAMAQKPIVTVDVPVPLDNGQRYVLTQAFFPEYFSQLIKERELPEGWIVGIFDSNGATIARSVRHEEFVARPGNPELVAAAQRSREGELEHPSREGIPVFDAFTHTSRAGWFVAVGVPQEVLEAPARRAVGVAGLGMLVALGGAVVVAFLLGRRLERAIAGAARSASALGRGEAPLFSASNVSEIDQLQATLAEAGAILMRERNAREVAEAERARLLESEQEARRLAEAQNEAKDEFLAMLGHELRNPLSAISGAVAVMESEAARPEAQAYAREVVARQSGHLGRIVDDLLDMSRVMTGKIRLDRQRVDLAEAARRCVGTLTAAGRTSRHALKVNAQPTWVEADPTRLDQVVANLLVNALKYTPDGGDIEVEVRPDGADALLMVRDTGVGISAALLPRVFDVFVQGAASLERGQGGLGIGLALVQRLVQMHGGSVSAASEGEGKGSVFTVRLAGVAPSEPAAGGVEKPAAGATPGVRVLIVDDHEDARMTLRMLLELLGYAVIEAPDGVEALRVAAAGRPDVAVVDIGLPGIDGYEVARRLRADPATRAIPLIALTGYGQQEDRRRALEAGFDEHLVKPVDAQHLVDAMTRALRR